jgi:hypothetical protein
MKQPVEVNSPVMKGIARGRTPAGRIEECRPEQLALNLEGMCRRHNAAGGTEVCGQSGLH